MHLTSLNTKVASKPNRINCLPEEIDVDEERLGEKESD